MYTISQLAKCFNLSRSTLLYYERAGLLTASGRSANNYRIYTQKDYAMLRKSCTLREVGIPLLKIKWIIKKQENNVGRLLEQRLIDLNGEIQNLRMQQHLIVKLLGNKMLTEKICVLNKEQWVAMLRAAGLDDAGMQKWHQEFERSVPQGHQDFLESLGINAKEIKEIRKLCGDACKAIC